MSAAEAEREAVALQFEVHHPVRLFGERNPDAFVLQFRCDFPVGVFGQRIAPDVQTSQVRALQKRTQVLDSVHSSFETTQAGESFAYPGKVFEVTEFYDQVGKRREFTQLAQVDRVTAYQLENLQPREIGQVIQASSIRDVEVGD
ncbi:hypothetical protein ACFXPY_09450 [Streptomyces sp. NPDC059153]|uniref:hypothetical protein n=1 Tax=Streptomyces sp. NPDC059153 TaxID=3346743 RepID=UPI0036C17CBC